MNPDDPRIRNLDDGIARLLYREGQNGLQIAETVIEAQVTALLHVRAGRAQDPRSFAAYGPDDSPQCAARRIIANLIDAGWRPPDTECLALPEDAS